jgi:predicted TIM-barrel fold metal-dependent hydrolase
VRIDAHIHVGWWNHADFLGRGISLEDTIEMLTRTGLDGAIVMPTDKAENQLLLDAVRRLARPQGPALWMFAWMRPGNHDDLEFVRRNAGQVAGVKCHPSLTRTRLSDPAFGPALDLAAELGIPVNVHCGRWQEMAGFRHALDAAAAHPRTQLICAHGGGDTPPLTLGAAEAVRERSLANVVFEFCGVREYWAVERAIGILGADRYLFASDFPLAHPLMYLGSVEAMALTPVDKALVLGGNARRLLRVGRHGGAE